MKKKYTISLIALVTLLTVSLSITTSYGLWKITKNEKSFSLEEAGCFEIFYNDGEKIDITGLKPLNEENGKNTNPYTFSIKNTCNETKTAEIRLNLLEDNTLETRALTVYMTGEIDLGPIKYNDLKNSRSSMENISGSKILTSIDISANSTIRTNLKTWIDEKVVSNIDPNLVFKASIEVTDKESIVLPTFKETILENNGGKEKIDIKPMADFAAISTTQDGLFATNDQDGTSYYFRGSANNNYVSFANLTWRIIRVNGDETVRLILQDTITDTEFNKMSNAKDFAGFTYKGNNTTLNSTIKDSLDSWYNENITSNFDKYVSYSKFCNDTNNHIEGYKTLYNGASRILNTKTPQLTCETTKEDYGGLYRLKVGLITADELIMAGANISQANSEIYLNNETSYYTMTPSDYHYYSSYMFAMDKTGSVTDYQVNSKRGVRPVISLKSNLIVTGDGTIDNPYKIDEDVN